MIRIYFIELARLAGACTIIALIVLLAVGLAPDVAIR